ncbi:hypothetical protein [Fulvivirga lutea]|uniref:CsbD family protein n=1 Tax=Fulvivirga lutea TaxID=2810512 RepID=A0A974WG58_9BACT|nr:hypothetical protein [Fulvivirga lutea]QSE96437.1 hypothetical protein JR347_12590 [Fulvivirga lutea]
MRKGHLWVVEEILSQLKLKIMENSKDQKVTEPFKITGDWKGQSTQLKNKYPQLTDEDLKFESGKENELVKRVETRLNKNREEVVNIIKKAEPAKAI